MSPKKKTNLDENGYPSELKKKPPKEELYDYSRTQGVDPRDPRATGSPCLGHHVPAKPGRGSVTGSNKFATWTGCQVCQLRLSYTPAFGAHALTRKAGPLTVDTEREIKSLPPNELAGNMNLKDQKIGLDGAETSLLRRLEQVQKQKMEWQEKQPTKKEGTSEKKHELNEVSTGAQTSKTCTPTTRKTRKPEATAEEHEAQVHGANSVVIQSDGEEWSLPTVKQ